MTGLGIPSGHGAPASASYRAVVVAGGRAKRLGSMLPKSLLQVNGKPLLRYTVDELLKAGAGPILVCFDRTECIDATRDSLMGLTDVSLFQDSGYPSTFQVFASVSHMMAERCIFAYGHAPRHHAHLMNLLNDPCSVAVSTMSASSMRTVIKAADGRFIEPPYAVAREIFLGRTELSWNEFFLARQQAGLSLHRVDGPSEFNTRNEFAQYAEYVAAQFRAEGFLQRSPGTSFLEAVQQEIAADGAPRRG